MKCSFPHMGNYYIAFEALFKTLGMDFFPPPPITKRTVELGARFSPEFVCLPFKITLGNLIEASEQGAEILFQTGGRGACRLGFYLDIQEKILQDIGFDVQVVRLFDPTDIAYNWQILKKLNPEITIKKIVKAIRIALAKIEAIDTVEDSIRRKWPYIMDKSEVERLYRVTLDKISQIDNPGDLKPLVKQFKKTLSTLDTHLNKSPIKIGIIGELYVVMEPYSNFELEKQLREMDVEVIRPLNLSHILKDTLYLRLPHRRHMRIASPYLKFDCCSHANDSVAEAIVFAKNGVDGVIHVKPHACMPEVTAMSALYRVSKDYNIPILFFSFDEHTSSLGVRTRLEAFVELLKRRKRCI